MRKNTMGENLTQADIIINVIIQFLNVALFFYLFTKFAGKYISKAIEERKIQQKKLENADAEYEKMIANATKRRENLMAEALSHKSQLVEEGKTLAEQEKEKILEKAQREAALVLEKANQEAKLKSKDLDQGFEEGVKLASMSVLKKLFSKQKDLKDSYLEGLVDEFSSSYKK